MVNSRMSIHRNRIFFGHRQMRTMNMVNMISNMAEPFRVVCLLIIALVNPAKNLRTPVF